MYNRANWSVAEAIQKRVDEESWVEWGTKPVAEITYDYTPHKFQLTEAAKEAFSKGIYYAKLLRL